MLKNPSLEQTHIKTAWFGPPEEKRHVRSGKNWQSFDKNRKAQSRFPPDITGRRIETQTNFHPEKDNMNATRKTLLLLLALIALPLMASDDNPQKDRTTQEFMRRKLGYADAILQGLTLEKFDLVFTNAIKLRNMNMTNAFVTLGNPEYRQKIENFQKSVEALASHAQDGKLDLATTSYSQVIHSCVDCHKTFRHEQFLQHNAPAGEKGK